MNRLPHLRIVTLAASGIVALGLVSCKKKTTDPTPVLSGVSLAASTVAAGSSVQGTVTLSAAPSSAASVALSSSNPAATVPGTVSVGAGATSAGFTVNTNAVPANTQATISASFSGTTQTASLTVTRSLLGSFSVVSLSPAFRKRDNSNGQIPDANPVQVLPTGTADACPLISNGGNQILDCRFDGSASTAGASPIAQYIWTYSFGTQQRTETSATAQFQPTAVGCNFFGGQGNGTQSGGLTFIGMKVDLQVKDAAGNTSPVTSNQNVRLFPAGQCGYGF